MLSTRSGATQGVRVTVYASAAEVTRRRRQVWLLVGGLAVVGTAAAVGLAVLQARRFVRPLQRLVEHVRRASAPATSPPAPAGSICPSSTA